MDLLFALLRQELELVVHLIAPLVLFVLRGVQVFSDLLTASPQPLPEMIFLLFGVIYRAIELVLTICVAFAAWRNRERIMNIGAYVVSRMSLPQNPTLTSSAMPRRLCRPAPPPRVGPLDQLESRLRANGGDENVSLIIAVDFTSSNEKSGRRTYGGRSLHAITTGSDDIGMNPYECAILRCGSALLPFDSDRKVPMWGFGDSQSRGKSYIVLSADKEDVDCSGPDGAMPLVHTYRAALSSIKLSAPTTFAPIVKAAADIARRAGNMHVLVILCDGAVSAECMDDTREAIENASMTAPLSILIVGIGDGGFGQMRFFDGGSDNYEGLDGHYDPSVVGTPFDNVHFIAFDEVMESARAGVDRNEHFAAAAFEELPQHYLQMCRRGLLTDGQSAAAAARVDVRESRQRSFSRRY